MMDMIKSADGTTIAYQRGGAGEPLIFVVGAFNDHHRCADLASALADRFTVITYDRRARGESGDTRPYAIEREIEDLNEVIGVAGGAAHVFGYSSGALLALAAAGAGSSITRLVLFEPAPAPHGASTANLSARLQALVDEGRDADAVSTFQTDAMGMPPEMVAQIRQSPMFPQMEAMAQSVVYDTLITETLAGPTAAMREVTTPTLVLAGAATWPILSTAAAELAAALPAASFEAVPGGANHDIPTATTAEVLRRFLS